MGIRPSFLDEVLVAVQEVLLRWIAKFRLSSATWKGRVGEVRVVLDPRQEAKNVEKPHQAQLAARVF